MQDVVSADVDKELTLRKEASDLIQLILLVLNASHTALPAARWFSTRVVDALRTMSKVNKVRVSLPAARWFSTRVPAARWFSTRVVEALRAMFRLNKVR